MSGIGNSSLRQLLSATKSPKVEDSGWVKPEQAIEEQHLSHAHENTVFLMGWSILTLYILDLSWMTDVTAGVLQSNGKH